MFKSSLILEGGGMRGVYTAGVIDFFLDKDISFECMVGVSAGACHATNLKSRQRGRSFATNTDYLDGKEYLSVQNYLKTGNMFGVDYIFDDIPNKLNPFDYKTFRDNPSILYSVSTDLHTGNPVYRPIINMKTDMDYVKASMALPVISKPIEIDGKTLMDGAVSDSIPIQFALNLGYQKNVIILTQCVNYRKNPSQTNKVASTMYRKYPNFLKKLNRRNLNYNNTLNYIELLQHQKQVFVIQPKEPVQISRLEKDMKKLSVLYIQGYKDAEASYEDLLAYIEM